MVTEEQNELMHSKLGIASLSVQKTPEKKSMVDKDLIMTPDSSSEARYKEGCQTVKRHIHEIKNEESVTEDVQEEQTVEVKAPTDIEDVSLQNNDDLESK